MSFIAGYIKLCKYEDSYSSTEIVFMVFIRKSQ